MYGMAATLAVAEPVREREKPRGSALPLTQETHRLKMLDGSEHTIEVLNDEAAKRQFAEHLGIPYPLERTAFVARRARKIERIKDGVQIYPPPHH